MPRRQPAALTALDSRVRRAMGAIVEAIERRTLLSGGSVVLAADGTLTVTGTNATDDIHVSLNVDTAGIGPVDVTLNGVVEHFVAPSVKRIVVTALGGNDIVLEDGFDLANPAISATIRGGDGNDDLRDQPNGGAGAFSDLLDGGSGNDYLSAFGA